jgi:hypothetical protein
MLGRIAMISTGRKATLFSTTEPQYSHLEERPRGAPQFGQLVNLSIADHLQQEPEGEYDERQNAKRDARKGQHREDLNQYCEQGTHFFNSSKIFSRQ